MMDFLKANPAISREEYLWDMTAPQVKLATYDSTHVEYLTEHQSKIEKARKHKIDSNNLSSFASDLGVPIFKSNK